MPSAYDLRLFSSMISLHDNITQQLDSSEQEQLVLTSVFSLLLLQVSKMDADFSVPQVHVVAWPLTNLRPDSLDDWVVVAMCKELYKFHSSTPSLQLGGETDNAIARYKGNGQMPWIQSIHKGRLVGFQSRDDWSVPL